MCFHFFYRLLIGAFVVIDCLAFAVHAVETPESCLAALRRVGDEYAARFSCEGTASDPSSGKPDQVIEWKYTRQDKRRSLIQTRTEVIPPDATTMLKQHQLRARFGGVTDPRLESYNTTSENVFLNDPTLCASIRHIVIFVPDGNGKLARHGDTFSVAKYPPDSDSLSLHYQVVEMAMGRDIQRSVGVITSVRETKGGLLEVAGPGTWFRQSGMWTMKLEPRLDYLIRTAEFQPENRGMALEMKNEGVVEQGGCIVPATAEYRLVGLPSPVETKVEFKSAQLNIDEETFERANTILAGPFAKGSMIRDYRVSPPSVESVGYPHSKGALKKL